MAELRCPMCGKSNPTDLEDCLFCGARLKPLNISPDEPGSDTPSEAGAPDWLQDFRPPGAEEQPPFELEDQDTDTDQAQPDPGQEEDLPEWLSSLDRSAFEEEGEDQQEKPAEREQAAGFSSLEAPAFGEVPQENQREDIPEWFHRLDTEQPEEESSDPAPEAGAQQDDWDWLAELEPERDTGEPARPAEEPASGRPEETPGWFDIPGKPEPAPFTAQADDLSELDALDGGELPAWLKEITPQAGNAGQAPGVIPPFQPPDEPEEQLDPNLAQADLPGWLESLRPVEAAAGPVPSGDEQENVASAGPLAGLSGVLPVEPGIPQVQKPPAYLMKLQISESQQAHAALFEQMLKTEAEARPVADHPRASSQLVLRLSIALLLFLSILWPLLTNSPQLGQPAFSMETVLASRLVEALDSGSPVLVAFDYEPGFSAEMDSAASAAVDHLINRGAYLAVVSTTPTGPVQAERLLSALNRSGERQYQSPASYANLGFIPGGHAGLLSFAETPRQLMPVTFDGLPAWQIEALQAVQTLDDFSLALVITENPDTARAWIEQVKPYLTNTPLVMVISSQAEPMIRPYYQADPPQVQGLVVGLAGGANYESLLGQGDLTQNYWTPLSLALLSAVLLILLGGILNAVLALLGNRGKVKHEDEREP